jgi:hypothetical protein
MDRVLGVKAFAGRISSRRLAQVLIAGVLIALLRSLAEFFRLRQVRGSSLALDDVAPYIVGGIIAGTGALAGVIAYFATRYRLAAVFAAVTILTMLAYKVAAIGAFP